MDCVVGPRDGFSEKIAEKLGKQFIELDTKIFSDNEIKPTLSSNEIKGKEVLVVNRTKASSNFDPNSYLIELLFTIRNLKELGARKITVFMPYFVYGRQDKIFLRGEPLSSRYVFDLLKQAGADRLITVNSHMYRQEGKLDYYPDLDAYNLSVFPLIGEYTKKVYSLENPLVMGPDFTSNGSAKEVADVLGTSKISLTKTRDLETGRIKTEGNIDVSGRDILIVDDIASSGGTLEKAIKICKQNGAEKIICVVVHPVLAKNCLDKIKETGAEFIATNTIDSKISKIDITDKVVEFLKVIKWQK